MGTWRRWTAAATVCVVTTTLGVAGTGTSAEAFSSVIGIDEHAAIVDKALSCKGNDAPLVDPACFEPAALSRLKTMVDLPDSLNGNIAEDYSAAHCDNGDYLPDESAAAPETFEKVRAAVGSRPSPVYVPFWRRLLLEVDIHLQYPQTKQLPGSSTTIPWRAGYPQTQQVAKAAIQACIDHHRKRVEAAAKAALAGVENGGNNGGNGLCGDTVAAHQPDLATPGAYSMNCLAMSQFGRSLHTVQDFYAHSNWVDPPKEPGQPLLLIPPGLNRTKTTLLFNLSGPTEAFPADLITGCYAYGAGDDCTGRVTHGNKYAPDARSLSKDDARYDASHLDYGRPALFKTAFDLAVTATQEQWAQLKTRIRATAKSPERAALAICIMTHDSPRVCSALAVTTASLPDATVGQPYNLTLAATGGIKPYAWTASGLPDGLGVNRTTGVISGVPTRDTAATGPAGVLITVTDDAGVPASVILPLNVKPKATQPPPEPGAMEVLTNGAGYGAVPGPDGRVWLVARAAGVVGATKVQAVNPATLQIQTYSPATTSTFRTAPTFDGQGNLWLAQANGKLARYNPVSGAFTEFALPAGCGAAAVAGLHTAGDGNVWVNCAGSTTPVVRVTPAGAMLLVPPLSTAPVLGELTPGAGGSMWAVGYSAGFAVGLVRISSGGGAPVLYRTANGIGTYAVAGNGSRVVEVGYCPLRLDTTCLQDVSDGGGRTQLNTRENAAPDLLRIYPPAIAANGDVWALVNGSSVGPYYYQFGGSGTVHPFKMPANSHVGSLIPGLDIPPVITADGALWVEETSTGILMRVVV
ncbi:hypothetical protein GCM10022255_082000 [Dactylosporangium darangshiense]|uniref:Uncharacterized protein n=1 Tax=Dactylosporangium darangshiense TaxID=579108 RepID=A0ABP8DLW8_9ACTN